MLHFEPVQLFNVDLRCAVFDKCGKVLLKKGYIFLAVRCDPLHGRGVRKRPCRVGKEACRKRTCACPQLEHCAARKPDGRK